MKTDYWVSDKKSFGTENLYALNDFLLTLKSENKSPVTVDEYRRALENFINGITKNLSDLTSIDIYNVIERMSNGKAKSTKLFYIHVLSTFFAHCRKEGYINKTLIKKRWYPKLNRPLPRGLEKNEQEQLKMAAERLSLVHRVIVEFLLSSGCRCNELRLLKISDINIQSRTARVLGKGNKWRVVFFSETAANVLSKYLEKHSNNCSSLLETSAGKRVTSEWIRLMVKECVDEAGLKHEISPHFFRHAFAGNLLAKGKDEDVIKDALGHENCQTTDIYLDVLPEEIVEWYHRCMG